MEKKKVGFALCGSFCTFRPVIDQMKQLSEIYDITPIMSFHAANMDTRFGRALDFVEELEQVCGHHVIKSIQEAEPIGPKEMFDLLVVSPCTGNTLAKLAASITDTPVTMAVKSHLRGAKPVLIGVSTNDALSGNAKNIGQLMNMKHFYFVPMRQDDPVKKPNSLVARFDLLAPAMEAAMDAKQMQPVFLS